MDAKAKIKKLYDAHFNINIEDLLKYSVHQCFNVTPKRWTTEADENSGSSYEDEEQGQLEMNYDNESEEENKNDNSGFSELPEI